MTSTDERRDAANIVENGQQPLRTLPSHLEESKCTQHFDDLSRETRACSTHSVTSSKKPRSRAFRPEKDVIRPKQARRERERVSGMS